MVLPGDPMTVKALGVLNAWYRETAELLEAVKSGDQGAYPALVEALEWAQSDEAEAVCRAVGLSKDFLDARVKMFMKEILQ